MLCVLQIVATSCLRCGVASDNLCAMAKMALGKGLSALIAAQPVSAPGIGAVEDAEKIPRRHLYKLNPSPLQPGKDFGAGSLAEVGETIRQPGNLPPLVGRDVEW